MSYPLLSYGNKLPAVGIAQKLLNARAGSSLVADGDFGSKTKEAVKSFQRPRGLVVDGVIGANTWGRISQQTTNLKIVDCIDVFDPSLYNLEYKDIIRAGGSPITIGGMSNGVEQAISDIIRAAGYGNVFLLRFHGHGASGNAGISDGDGSIPGEHGSSLHMSNWAYLEPIVRRLAPIFGSYGCIQFMHCNTGQGSSGRTLLQNITNATGVPSSAGIRTQYGGGLSTFKFEGPTYSAFPVGQNLKSWSSSRPDFIGMSVP